jgi:hypothetical protein
MKQSIPQKRQHEVGVYSLMHSGIFLLYDITNKYMCVENMVYRMLLETSTGVFLLLLLLQKMAFYIYEYIILFSTPSGPMKANSFFYLLVLCLVWMTHESGMMPSGFK